MFTVYIAVCSLITGVVIGLICAKWTDLQTVKDNLQLLIAAYSKSIDAHNKSFGRLFDINREILKVHLTRTDYDYAMSRIEALEPISTSPDAHHAPQEGVPGAK